MPDPCQNCPNHYLSQICERAKAWSNIRIIACGQDSLLSPPEDYIELAQQIKVATPEDPLMVIYENVVYRYYLDADQLSPRYEANINILINVTDSETFLQQIVQLNNLGEDILDDYGWDIRLDTQWLEGGKDIANYFPRTLELSLSRNKDKFNDETFIDDLIEATLDLDAAIAMFYYHWRKP
jgi:hypothetical protein